jgi:Uma2 family endonuclease
MPLPMTKTKKPRARSVPKSTSKSSSSGSGLPRLARREAEDPPLRTLPPEKAGHYTYADWENWDWPEGYFAELIYGEVYEMCAPAWQHQIIAKKLVRKIDGFLIGKTPVLLFAPFGIRLFATPDKSDNTIVLPDIIVFCDPARQHDEKCGLGAPDFIIEIHSPSNKKHDRSTKFDLYKKSGVREYWMVDNKEKRIDVNLLRDGSYETTAYRGDAIVPVVTLPGCEIDLRELFAP